jgi:uncharacterized protein (UPF0332 family)
MINKSHFNDSIIYSYLSMFYSVRLLLVEHDEDSDDYEHINKLMDAYYQPSGWTNLNIVQIIREAREFKNKVESQPGIRVSKADAEKFNEKAAEVLKEIKKQLQPLSDIQTAPSE